MRTGSEQEAEWFLQCQKIPLEKPKSVTRWAVEAAVHMAFFEKERSLPLARRAVLASPRMRASSRHLSLDDAPLGPGVYCASVSHARPRRRRGGALAIYSAIRTVRNAPAPGLKNPLSEVRGRGGLNEERSSGRRWPLVRPDSDGRLKWR